MMQPKKRPNRTEQRLARALRRRDGIPYQEALQIVREEWAEKCALAPALQRRDGIPYQEALQIVREVGGDLHGSRGERDRRPSGQDRARDDIREGFDGCEWGVGR